MFISIVLFNIFFIISSKIISCFQCEKDGFFPDKRDCWIYHICVGTTHTIKACKEDLLFNPIKSHCDWAMNVNCTSENPRPTVINSISPFDFLCQSVDNDYIAHPNDCKQYAYCANGIPQPKLCKRSLMWSQTEKMCVWPAQSDCPVKNPTTTTTTTSETIRTTLSISQAIAPSFTNIPPSRPLLRTHKSSTICPPNESKRVPDPYDCAIYHDCYEGTDLISYCPGLLQYNHEKQTCSHMQNVQCKNKCTIENEGARFIDPKSCCHFYECRSGELVLQTCLQPNLFDFQTRKCLPHKQVICDGRKTCSNKCHYLSNHDNRKTSCDTSTLCTGHSNGYYLDRSKPNCQSYIQCLDNYVVNSNRCPNGQRFNKNIGRCTSADQVPCFASKLSNQILLIVFLLLLIGIRY